LRTRELVPVVKGFNAELKGFSRGRPRLRCLSKCTKSLNINEEAYANNYNVDDVEEVAKETGLTFTIILGKV
jgi:hypothetical protein